MGEIIGTIIFGFIIGLLGKWVAPKGKDNIPIWLTLICGVGGALIGYWLWDALGGTDTKGIDWWRWVISVLAAAVLVMVAATITGRSKKA